MYFHPMKKISIILNVVLIIVVLFFVLYAQIQTSLAAETNELANANAHEAAKNAEIAAIEAANAREAEAQALDLLTQLEICQSSK
jgi:hypothetical protein